MAVLTYLGPVVDAPEVVAIERARVGSLEGDEWDTLGRIESGLLLSDGSFVLGDRQTGRIHFYDGMGSHQRTVGQVGSGPGDFQSIRRMTETAEGIDVWDIRLQRVTQLTTRGRVSGTIRPPEGRWLFDMVPWHGGYVGFQLIESPSPPGLDQGLVLRSDSAQAARVSGALYLPLFRFPDAQSGVAVRGGVQVASTVPFGFKGGTAPTGDGFVSVHSGTPEIVVRDADGRTVQTVRLPDLERPFNASVGDSLLDVALLNARDPNHRRVIEENWALPYPAQMPTIEYVQTNGSGSMILRLHRVWSHNGRRPWVLLSLLGRTVRILWLDERDRVLDFEDSRLLTVTTADTGIPQAVLLELVGG